MSNQVWILEREAEIAMARLRAAKSLALYGSGRGAQQARAYYRQARRHLRRAGAAVERLEAYRAGTLYPCTP